jgi:hypothetical protein
MKKKRSTFRGLRRRKRTPRLALVLAAVGTAAGAAGALAARKRLAPGSPAQADQPDGRAAEPTGQKAGGTAEAPASQTDQTNHGEAGATWTCQCGQEFRVSGRDRHRLYWLPDAKPEDPILDDRCPTCERQLSAEPAG